MFLTTDRLILRPFEADDLERFAAINADPEVMQFFPAPLTAHETADMALPLPLLKPSMTNS